MTDNRNTNTVRNTDDTTTRIDTNRERTGREAAREADERSSRNTTPSDPVTRELRNR